MGGQGGVAVGGICTHLTGSVGMPGEWFVQLIVLKKLYNRDEIQPEIDRILAPCKVSGNIVQP